MYLLLSLCCCCCDCVCNINISLLAIIIFVIVSKLDHKVYKLYSDVSFDRVVRFVDDTRRFRGQPRIALVYGLLFPAGFLVAAFVWGRDGSLIFKIVFILCVFAYLFCAFTGPRASRAVVQPWPTSGIHSPFCVATLVRRSLILEPRRERPNRCDRISQERAQLRS